MNRDSQPARSKRYYREKSYKNLIFRVFPLTHFSAPTAGPSLAPRLEIIRKLLFCMIFA